VQGSSYHARSERGTHACCSSAPSYHHSRCPAHHLPGSEHARQQGLSIWGQSASVLVCSFGLCKPAAEGGGVASALGQLCYWCPQGARSSAATAGQKGTGLLYSTPRVLAWHPPLGSAKAPLLLNA
jgi:hypothetical protein